MPPPTIWNVIDHYLRTPILLSNSVAFEGETRHGRFLANITFLLILLQARTEKRFSFLVFFCHCISHVANPLGLLYLCSLMNYGDTHKDPLSVHLKLLLVRDLPVLVPFSSWHNCITLGNAMECVFWLTNINQNNNNSLAS